MITNADMKTLQYIRLLVNIAWNRFHILIFWDNHSLDMQSVCSKKYRNNSKNSFKRVVYFLRKMQIFRGYYFYVNTNIQGHFEICISVPLICKFIV